MLELGTGTEVERYVIEGLIGQGGMATVYRVRHSQLGTRHALKILSVPSQNIRDRMLQEGRVQATLNHPNILAVTDVIDVRGAPGLLMEYVPGPSLADLLVRRKLAQKETDDLAAGILAGVAEAHNQGLVHRDLKPANILLATVRGRVVPKVADFGLAKILAGSSDAGKTRSGATMGTPAYMAPEQIRDAKSVDARADVFALGAILYELVGGTRAFEGEDTLELFLKISGGKYRPLAELDPAVPPRIVAAIGAALQIDPAQRPQSCEALWALWAPETGPLDGAADIAGASWSSEVMEVLGQLTVQEVQSTHDPSHGATQDWLSDDSTGEQSALVAPPYAETLPDAVPSPVSMPSLSSAPGTGRGILIGLVGALVLMGVGFGVASYTLSFSPEISASAEIPAAVGAPAEVPVPVPPEPAAVPPVVEEPPEPIPEVPTPSPVPAAPPVPAVAAVPEPPSQAPAPVQVATGTMVLMGDAERVSLVPVDGGPARSPGAVPVGKYTVEAVFSGKNISAGIVEIRAGETTTLKCASAIRNCVAQ